MTNNVFVIILALLQGPTAPVARTPQWFTATPSLCPFDFCDDFQDVCLDAGASDDSCHTSTRICEATPCQACDAAVTDCNLNGGKHCDEIGTKCRDALKGCCTLTVPVECTSTESLGAVAEQFCMSYPWGRPESCSPNNPPSAAACHKVIAAMDGCDITLCDYKACAAALLTATCDEIPVECELIAAC